MNFIKRDIDLQTTYHKSMLTHDRFSFTYQLLLTMSRRINTEVSLVADLYNTNNTLITKTFKYGRTFYLTKEIVCTINQELWRRAILLTRQKGKLAYFQQQKLKAKILQQTKISAVEGQSEQRVYQIDTQFCELTNIFRVLSTKKGALPEMLNEEQRIMFINKIMVNLLIELIKLPNQQFYTFQNIFFIENQTTKDIKIKINQISFVGMKFIMQHQPISKKQFAQIFQLLGSETLSQKNPFSIQLKIRAIGMLLLHLIIETRISLFDIIEQQQNMLFQQNMLSFQVCENLLKKYSKKYFEELLNNTQVIKKILTLENRLNVNYYNFLRLVFIQQAKLKWSQVIDMCCQKWTPQPQKNKLFSNNRPPLQFQDLINRFKMGYEQKYGDAYTALLNRLGLSQDTELKAYFIGVISEQIDFADYLISYENLDEFFYYKSDLDIQHKNAIFKFINTMLNVVTEGNQFSLVQKYAKEVNLFKKSSKFNNDQQQRFISIDQLNKSNSKMVNIHNCHPIQALQKSNSIDSQIIVQQSNYYQNQSSKRKSMKMNDKERSYISGGRDSLQMQILFNNFSRLQLNLKNKRFITQQPKSRDFHKFMRVFK